MKQCSKCNKNLKISEYYFRKDSKSYRSWCKNCEKSRTKKYNIENSKKVKENKKKYYILNREKLINKSQEYYQSVKNDPIFKIKSCERSKKWKKENPEKHAIKETKRRLKLIKATPKWLSKEEVQKIKGIYRKCKSLTNKETGVYYHVDHIIPLQGTTVSGLHVPWNLQIIKREINLKKHNKLGGKR